MAGSCVEEGWLESWGGFSGGWSLGFNVVVSSTSLLRNLLRTLSVLISISTVSVFVVVSSSPEVVVSNSLVISVSRGASVESDDGDEDG